MVGTVLSAGAALKFGLDVRDVNSQLDQYRRFQCMGDPPMTANCDVNGQRPRSLCRTTLPEKSHNLTEQGNQDQLLQWVFVGLTGAFAIAGGVLLYKGYLSSEGKQSASNHGLRLFPTATASSGGIIAEFEF